MEIAASSILSGLQMQQNAVQQYRAQQFNEQLWQKQFAAQNSRQDALNLDSYTTKMAAARRAGLNPLVALGGTSTYSDSVTAPNVDASLKPTEAPNFAQSFLQSLQIKQQAELNEAQINNLNEQTRKQNIENTREETRDSLIRNFPVTVGGKTVYLENLGAVSAITDTQSLPSILAKYDEDEFTSRMELAIKNAQMKDKDVFASFVEMPKYEREKFSAEIKSILADVIKKNAETYNIQANTSKIKEETRQKKIEGKYLEQRLQDEQIARRLQNAMTDLEIRVKKSESFQLLWKEYREKKKAGTATYDDFCDAWSVAIMQGDLQKSAQLVAMDIGIDSRKKIDDVVDFVEKSRHDYDQRHKFDAAKEHKRREKERHDADTLMHLLHQPYTPNHYPYY